MALKAWFRVPVCPVICDLQTHLAAAQTGKLLEKILTSLHVPAKVRLIDCTGEAWMYLPEQPVMAPVFRLGWKKREVIELFNNSANAVVLSGVYPDRVIANRTLERIIVEIASLVESSQQRASALAAEHPERFVASAPDDDDMPQSNPAKASSRRASSKRVSAHVDDTQAELFPELSVSAARR